VQLSASDRVVRADASQQILILTMTHDLGFGALRARLGLAGWLGLGLARWGRRFDELPEPLLADHLHRVSLRGQPPNFHQLQASDFAGDLQRVRPAAY